MFAQVHSRALNVILSFETHLPFDKCRMWRELRALPLAEQKQALHDPDDARAAGRRRVQALRRPGGRGAEARPPDWDWIYAMTDMRGPHKSMAELARRRTRIRSS